MRTRALSLRGASGFAVVAVALLLTACVKSKPSPMYSVGGAVSGMSGAGLVLQNNGSNNLPRSANGAFTFSRELQKGETYKVTVFTQPTGQNCTVSNGTGTVAGDVTSVGVACGGGAFTVGGTVSGLTSAGLVLQDNGANDLPISANGAFTFAAPIGSGGSYNVTVLSQPTGQQCTVSNGSGTVASTVTNVAVACVNMNFTVGGAVSGLTGTGLVLQNNGRDNLAIAGNGAFSFATTLANGTVYDVKVSSQPSGQGCSVANGGGTIAGTNVTNVTVNCVAPPGVPSVNPLTFGVKELRFSWPAASGATFYRLLENPDGLSGYSQVATDITALGYNLTIPVYRRLNASYIVEACNVAGCTDSAPLNVGTDLTKAIGYAKASNSDPGDAFGIALAVSGDGNTLAVGARIEASSTSGIDSTPNNSAPGAGAVYVFARGASGWAQQAYVKASNPEAQDGFGWSVSLSGDGSTLAVGAPNESSSLAGVHVGVMTELDAGNGAPQAGAVYVFIRSGSTWAQQVYVKKPLNTVDSDLFGSSVALSDDGQTLAVGAPGESTADIFAGAAFVYSRNLDGWLPQGSLMASDAGFDDELGTSIALSGDGNTLAVGAPMKANQVGAGYVFVRSGGTWSQQTSVTASNAQAGDRFGWSVAISGDGNTLAVGAPLEDGGATGVGGTPDEGSLDSGAVYLFARSGSAWSQQTYVKASNTGSGDNFGWSVALSGDGNTLSVGAPLEDGSATGIGGTSDEGAIDAGAVYLYTRGAGTWSQSAYVKASNTGAGDNFGWCVTVARDGNTLAVGANMEDGGSSGIGSTQTDNAKLNAGAAYLY
jgi:FG-GAP repeat protein